MVVLKEGMKTDCKDGLQLLSAWETVLGFAEKECLMKDSSLSVLGACWALFVFEGSSHMAADSICCFLINLFNVKNV